MSRDEQSGGSISQEGGLASVTGTVLIIAVIAGLVLSTAAIILGLFMLLSKGHASEAEGVWQDKLKVKGPVGLFVFCVGAALLVIIMRQITPPLFGDSGAPLATTPPKSTDDGNAGATPTPGRTQAEFISPQADSEINVGDDVSGSVFVAGLGGNKIWIVSRHDVGGSYYPIYPPIAKDGYQEFIDQGVGDSSDKGNNIVYFAVLANADCTQALSDQNFFRTLPTGCVLLDQRVVRVK
ncbi:MAG: hypothetical protein ACRDSZ_05325 [Pseudonocardiaceae bacterium]